MKFSDEEILDTNQVARFLNRSPGAIRNLVMRRDIPFRKVSGRLVFLREEITTWIEHAPGVRVEDLQRRKY